MISESGKCWANLVTILTKNGRNCVDKLLHRLGCAELKFKNSQHNQFEEVVAYGPDHCGRMEGYNISKT